MKTVLAIILCISVLFSTATAAGDPNVDIGGGRVGEGSSKNYWYGDEGIRVSIIDASKQETVSSAIDIMREPAYLQDWNDGNLYYFCKTNKLDYAKGASLVPVQGNYICYTPKRKPMPKIIKTNTQSASVEAIRDYFTDEQVLRWICDNSGFSYETLIIGDYRVMIEPLAHFLYRGKPFAMTATEAALYDELTGGDLCAKMAPLTHQNLPLALYLEKADLGYPAWTGSKTSRVSNAAIKASLGIGLVRFKETIEPITVDTPDYEYRVDTDVITAVTVSGGQADPDHPVYVTFSIAGTSYRSNAVYYPSGGSQLAWVKWHTPTSAQRLTIRVSVSGPGSAKGSLTANIVDLSGNDPPNPTADDRNDGFTKTTLPTKTEKDTASWGVWRPWWHAYWVWHSTLTGGYWCDHGWWEFGLDTYTATLSATMRLTPDENCPTASGGTMKSGYGMNQLVATRVSTNYSSATTGAQTSVSYFPEFNYGTYWRLLERTQTGLRAEFQFAKNRYSTYNSRTHFTPIWHPDGKYEVYTYVMDVWTPAGMLSLNLSDDVSIHGSMWDDWHIAPAR